MARKAKPPRQLDREIASSLSAGGQPGLAAMFADPEARRTFAREMRHEIQKKQLSQQIATDKSARPYSVKHIVTTRFVDGGERGVRELVGNYAMEAEARARADQVGGWVETRDGRVVYGVQRLR